MATSGVPPVPPGPRGHRSFVGPVVLILLGVFFLLWNVYPAFDPWPWLWRYWPLILIAIGLGKIWDSYYAHQHPERASGPWVTGTGLAWVILLLFFMFAFWHGRRWHGWNGWEPRHSWDEAHETQSLDLQGAKSVTADLQIPAGTLNLSGGSSKLLDADFLYDRRDWKPNVNYHVSGDQGQLSISEGDSHRVHWGNEDVDWTLRLGGNVPLDLNLNMGAGEGYLKLAGLDVEHLKVNMGAGRLDLDLTGPRKTNLDAVVEGGVGSATIRLPKDVGVHVNASGGIGSVDADGLRQDGDVYTNDAYGKTPISIDLTVHGGIGEIDLVQQ
jgi:N-terminal domain of toast_rack, DUF2154/Cell wall-active antibiotics response 4TMS YvqF/Domain of unknown function (DUF5668)